MTFIVYLFIHNNFILNLFSTIYKYIIFINDKDMKLGVTPNKTINLNALAFHLTGRLTAYPGETPKVGVTYIPALTLNLRNPAPKKKLLLTAAQTASLPQSFNWLNNSDVEQYKGHNYINLVMGPQNQEACGSCWAFATTTSFSDRIALVSGQNPMLGPSYLMSCGISDSSCGGGSLQGCNGGQIAAALNAMAGDAAGVPAVCWDYNWCSNNAQCSGKSPNSDENALNALIPAFTPNKNKCISSSNNSFSFFKTISNSTNTPTNFDQIKQAIFTKGPIPTGYMVYSDFIL